MKQSAPVGGEEATCIVSGIEAEQVQRLTAQEGVSRRYRDVDDAAEMVKEPGPALGIEQRSIVSLASIGWELKASRDAETDRPRDEVDGFAAENPDPKWVNVARAVIGAERDREVNDVVGFKSLI